MSVFILICVIAVKSMRYGCPRARNWTYPVAGNSHKNCNRMHALKIQTQDLSKESRRTRTIIWCVQPLFPNQISRPWETQETLGSVSGLLTLPIVCKMVLAISLWVNVYVADISGLSTALQPAPYCKFSIVYQSYIIQIVSIALGNKI